MTWTLTVLGAPRFRWFRQLICDHRNAEHHWTDFAECLTYCPDCGWRHG